MSLEVLVVGVGNIFRGDDGAGPAVASRLRDLVLPSVTVLEQSGEGTTLMAAWEGKAYVIVVDAMQSGTEPGTVHRLDVTNKPIPAQFSTHFSGHAFGVAGAVEMARLLGSMPHQLVVYGIEGLDFATGQGLSDAVERGVATAVTQIQQEITAVTNQST
jgi:hydrogenase maturation protease